MVYVPKGVSVKEDGIKIDIRGFWKIKQPVVEGIVLF